MARVLLLCNLNDVETRDGIFWGKGISIKMPSFLLPGVREGVVWCTGGLGRRSYTKGGNIDY